MYERQELIEGLNIPETATVVGLGGTGFWTALFLAMSGVKNLVLIDIDVIEESNLNRIIASTEAVGSHKLSAVYNLITNIRTETRIEAHPIAIKTESDCQILRGSVFCCTDTVKSQKLVNAYCRKNNLPYQRIGYDGTTVNVSRAFPFSFNEDNDDGGYRVTPSWVIPATLAASVGVFSSLCKNITLMGDMENLCLKGMSAIPQGLRERISHLACKSCDRGNCDDCDRGNCDDCDKGNCDDCDKWDSYDVEKAITEFGDAVLAAFNGDSSYEDKWRSHKNLFDRIKQKIDQLKETEEA